MSCARHAPTATVRIRARGRGRAAGARRRAPPALRARPHAAGAGRAPRPLDAFAARPRSRRDVLRPALDLHEEAGGLAGDLAYRTDLFEPATIARLTTHTGNCSRRRSTIPQRPLSRLSLLDEDERRAGGGRVEPDGASHPAEATVHALVQRQARGRRRRGRAWPVSARSATASSSPGGGAGGPAARRRGRARLRRRRGDGALAGGDLSRLPRRAEGRGRLPTLSVNDPPERVAFVVADAAAAAILLRTGTPPPAVSVPVLEVSVAGQSRSSPCRARP